MPRPASQRRRSVTIRILQLVELIRLGLAGSNTQLAQELGVSKRTVARDIALLRSADLPVIFDEARNCYRMLTADLTVGQRQLNVPEIEALLLAVASNSLPAESHQRHLATAAITKLSAALSVTNGLLASQKLIQVVSPASPAPATSTSAWDVVVTACREQRSVRLQIQCRRVTITTKVSEPRLFFQGEWLIRGRSSYHKANKTFPFRSVQLAELVEHAV